MQDYQLVIYGNWTPVKDIVLSKKLDKIFFQKLKKEGNKNVSKKVKH